MNQWFQMSVSFEPWRNPERAEEWDWRDPLMAKAWFIKGLMGRVEVPMGHTKRPQEL